MARLRGRGPWQYASSARPDPYKQPGRMPVASSLRGTMGMGYALRRPEQRPGSP
jgi:hypothetical protein